MLKRKINAGRPFGPDFQFSKGILILLVGGVLIVLEPVTQVDVLLVMLFLV
jgi:hypothetical protein